MDAIITEVLTNNSLRCPRTIDVVCTARSVVGRSAAGDREHSGVSRALSAALIDSQSIKTTDPRALEYQRAPPWSMRPAEG